MKSLDPKTADAVLRGYTALESYWQSDDLLDGPDIKTGAKDLIVDVLCTIFDDGWGGDSTPAKLLEEAWWTYLGLEHADERAHCSAWHPDLPGVRCQLRFGHSGRHDAGALRWGAA